MRGPVDSDRVSRFGNCPWLVPALASFSLLRGQSASTDMRKAMEASAERQRTSIGAMRTALTAQKASIQKQAAAASLAVADAAASDSFLTFPWPAPNPVLSSRFDCKPMPDDQLAPMIQTTSAREGVSAALIRAVAARESAFYPCAVSPKGAMGLMQLMPGTQKYFRVTDPFSPEQSLAAGSRLLKQLLDRYQGDLPKALGAYNAGAGQVDRAGGVPPIRETEDYVSGILTQLATGQ